MRAGTRRRWAAAGVAVAVAAGAGACSTTEKADSSSAAGCYWIDHPIQPGKVAAEDAILVDRSASFRASPDSNRGKALLGAVLDAAMHDFASARGNPVVSVGAFDASSSTITWQVRDLVLPVATGTSQGDQVADRTATRNCLAGKLTGLLGQAPRGPGTDVVGAFVAGARVLRSSAVASSAVATRRLVVFTDGLSNVGCANLTRSQDAETLATKCGPAEAQLDGIDVSLLGLGQSAGGVEPPDTGQETRLRNLWSSLCRWMQASATCVGDLNLPPDVAASNAGEADAPVELVGFEDWPDRVVITLPGDILFDTDSAVLSEQKRADLEQEVRKDVPAAYRSVEVAGYTDSRASASHNLVLSQQRADAVASVLRNLHLSHIAARGYGETALRCRHEFTAGVPDEACLQQNRRVVITIYKEER